MKRGNVRAKTEKEPSKENSKRFGIKRRKEEGTRWNCTFWSICVMGEGWDTYPELFSDCFLTEQSVCVWATERESMCVCQWLREGILPLLLLDCASLTGWRGRWGHCNKANTHTLTHTHTHTDTHTFFYGCYVLASLALSRLHTSIFPRLILNLLPSQTCSHSSRLVLPSESQSVCKALVLSLYLSSPTPPNPFAPIPSSLTVW